MSRNKWLLLLALVVVAGLFDVFTWSLLPRDVRTQDSSFFFAANPDNPALLILLKLSAAAFLAGVGLFVHLCTSRGDSRLLLWTERAAVLGPLFAAGAWFWGALSNVVPGLWWPGS